MKKTKVCFKCGSRKRITSFYRHSRMLDGHLGKCKACTKNDVKENRKKRASYYREYEKRRESDPARRRAATERRKRDRAKHPGKARARNAVNNAVRDGRLERGDCCMSADGRCKGRIEAHHADYRKPLDVVWVCSRHHRFLHGGGI